MDNVAVKQLLKQVLDDGQILQNEPMKNHTLFKIGGNADFLVQPNSVEQISRLIKLLKDIPYLVIGNGSNLLVCDEGVRKVIIKISNLLSKIEVNENIIYAESGAFLSKIANVAYNEGLSGFEWAAGIPGTLGGAVIMNAGAYGGEMKDVVVSTTYIDENGDMQKTSDHKFGYRTSVFEDKKCIIIGSEISLQPKNKDEIKAYMNELSEKRHSKQPLEYPSAGSTFKRPDGLYAGKLIEDAGLRGYSIGGATVSEKHCGFIINSGNATFNDVMNLIEYVQGKVYEQFGVELETEVKILR